MSTATNPLLISSGLPSFSDVRPEHVEPAIDLLIERCRQAIERAAAPDMPADFDAVAEVLDPALDALSDAWTVVDHLQSVVDTPALRAAHAAAQPKITSFFSDLSSDLRLFNLYKRIQSQAGERLAPAKRKALENSLIGFELSGAELDVEAKKRFAAIRLRSSELSSDFSNRLQDATDAFVYWATAADLAGLPEDVTASMRHAAIADGRQDGTYKVTLQQPSLVPVLMFAHNRELRRHVYRAQSTRASEFGPVAQDNTANIVELVGLRHASASMLERSNYAELSLTMKMADSPEQVADFLRDIAQRSREQAERDLQELRDFAKVELGLIDLQAWDVAYVSDKLRQARYSFSAQEVKQYFTLDKVLAGMFEIAESLFDIRIATDASPTWHECVTTYRVEREGETLGHFYLDPFARAAKRGGAWMSGARARWRKPNGEVRKAMALLVTNFAGPINGKAGLMSHSDVVTLFHEFGHGLHFLLSTVDVPGVAGLGGVEWDAIELPSQLMENFAWQWEILQRISAHVETEEPLPRVLYDKMWAARNFQSGMLLLRQVEMALFDIRLHAQAGGATEVQAILKQVRDEVAVMPVPDYNRFQNGFAHVFAGGYAAGYYSYLWAEVLSADAWSVFESSGPLSKATGARYRQAILERGGSRPMNDNFIDFVGRKPQIDAFLKSRGVACQA